MGARVSIGESISFGWHAFKARPGFFIGAFFTIVGVTIAVAIVEAIVTAIVGKEAGGVIRSLASIVVDTFVAMGVISLYLKAHDTVAAARIKDLWHPQPFWRFLGMSILCTAAVVVGLILFIIPGIIVGVMLMFSQYLVIDRGLGPIEALKESARITKGHRWDLFVLLLAVLALNIVGALLLVVGLLVSVPVTMLAMVHTYRTLSSNAAPILPVAAAPVPAA